MILLRYAVCGSIVLGAAMGVAEENWPQFRGPNALPVAEGRHPPIRWSATENVAWTQAIAGLGWSSPIVWGERVFVTACVSVDPTEEPRKGLYFGGNREDAPTAVHEWKVLCFDLATGRLLWEQTPHRGAPQAARHLKNSYASETPVTDGERLYVYFGNVGVFCFTLDGQEVWRKPLEPRRTRFGWGTAASPVLHQERLFLVNDNEEQSYLLALDAKTGTEIWRVPRDEGSNWSTPFVWENAVRTEIVTPGTNKNRAYDLEGKLLYEFEGSSSITIAQPYAAHGLLFVSSGYVMDPRKPVFAVRPGARGDISLEPTATANEFIAWRKDIAPYNPTTLVYGDHLYVLLDRGLFACYDARTGETVYDRQRIPNGGAFTASPWAYGGKVFCLNEDGVTFAVEAGRNFKIVAENRLADNEMSLATPAVAGDKLLIRTASRLYCIAEAP